MTIHARTFTYVPGPLPKRTPPPQRAKVLAFIQAELAAGLPFPSSASISAHMSWKHAGSVSHALEGLRIDGWLVRVSRSLCAKKGENVWRLAE